MKSGISTTRNIECADPETLSQASKVVVLGAAGGIGQPLSLLLKLNPRVTELALYDIKGGPGVAADVGHINTKSNVRWIDGKETSFNG